MGVAALSGIMLGCMVSGDPEGTSEASPLSRDDEIVCAWVFGKTATMLLPIAKEHSSSRETCARLRHVARIGVYD